MKILELTFSKLRNSEHFQFFSEFKELIERFGVGILRIVRLFAIFLKLYETEDECLLLLRKSAFSEKLSEGDRTRDNTFRGMRDAVNSGLNHFNKEKKEAAKRLKTLLNAYGNLARKPLDEIYNLVQDMQGKYAAGVSILGIDDWVAELNANNEAYRALVKQRTTETAEKPDEKMKSIRPQVEDAYENIIKTLKVFAMMYDSEEDKTVNKKFADELNAIITRYNNRLNQRKGGSGSRDDDGDDDADEPDQTPDDQS